MAGESSIGAASDSELRAAVGRGADYYLQRWAASHRGGFNWAAFLLTALWLPYRKLYRATALLYACILMESVLEDLVFMGWLGWAEPPRWLDRGVAFAVCGMCGSMGNRWYLEHVRRLVAEVNAGVPDQAARLAELAKRGGTSMIAAGVGAVVFVASIVAGIALVDAFLSRG